MAQREIIEIVKKYIAALRKHNIGFAKIILFGSRIQDIADKWSDIDIAVISSEFGKDRFDERVLLSRIAFEVDARIEAHPFSLNEFEHETWKMMIHELISTGVEIAA